MLPLYSCRCVVTVEMCCVFYLHSMKNKNNVYSNTGIENQLLFHASSFKNVPALSCCDCDKRGPIFRLTPSSRPNKVVSKVRPSTKSFVDFIEICYVGRGWWVMHDGMLYDPIQGQGHESSKVGNSAIFNGYLLPHL